ncbi:hypothetical protein [Microbacterium sp.]|uniref:hypothetical protein n=1 Tax=Microbacterium sp. TaxID=51671 RepID=UPI0028124B64|nr:hypothetical protein [Microbacterium sp.]
MSTTLLTADRRQNTSIHPPDTEDRQILTIPDQDGRRQLALTDRLSLRLGLWLLERSLPSSAIADRADAAARHERHQERQRLELAHRQSIALLTYDLQRRML